MGWHSTTYEAPSLERVIGQFPTSPGGIPPSRKRQTSHDWGGNREAGMTATPPSPLPPSAPSTQSAGILTV
jgi:hypothetical protein